MAVGCGRTSVRAEKGARAASDRKATAPRPEGAENGPAHPNGTFAENKSRITLSRTRFANMCTRYQILDIIYDIYEAHKLDESIWQYIY